MEKADSIPGNSNETMSSLNLSLLFRQSRCGSSGEDSRITILLPPAQSGQLDVSITQRSERSDTSCRHEDSCMVIDHTLAAVDRSLLSSHRNDTVGDLDESQWSSVSSSTRVSAVNPLISQSKVLRNKIQYNAARNLVPGVRAWNSPPEDYGARDDSLDLTFPPAPSHAPVPKMVPNLYNYKQQERKDRPIHAEQIGRAHV